MKTRIIFGCSNTFLEEKYLVTDLLSFDSDIGMHHSINDSKDYDLDFIKVLAAGNIDNIIVTPEIDIDEFNKRKYAINNKVEKSIIIKGIDGDIDKFFNEIKRLIAELDNNIKIVPYNTAMISLLLTDYFKIDDEKATMITDNTFFYNSHKTSMYLYILRESGFNLKKEAIYKIAKNLIKNFSYDLLKSALILNESRDMLSCEEVLSINEHFKGLLSGRYNINMSDKRNVEELFKLGDFIFDDFIMFLLTNRKQGIQLLMKIYNSRKHDTVFKFNKEHSELLRKAVIRTKDYDFLEEYINISSSIDALDLSKFDMVKIECQLINGRYANKYIENLNNDVYKNSGIEPRADIINFHIYNVGSSYNSNIGMNFLNTISVEELKKHVDLFAENFLNVFQKDYYKLFSDDIFYVEENMDIFMKAFYERMDKRNYVFVKNAIKYLIDSGNTNSETDKNSYQKALAFNFKKYTDIDFTEGCEKIRKSIVERFI